VLGGAEKAVKQRPPGRGVGEGYVDPLTHAPPHRLIQLLGRQNK
jgi:hypothetical protein